MILYNAPTLKILTPSIIKLLDDKVNTYQRLKLKDAGLAEFVGHLCGYKAEIVDTLREGVAAVHWQQEKVLQFSPGYSTDDIILHEMAHAWQTDFRPINGVRGMRETVHFEQQANSMAKYIYQKIHPGQRGYFDSYFTKESIDWLVKYYGSWKENDLAE